MAGKFSIQYFAVVFKVSLMESFTFPSKKKFLQYVQMENYKKIEIQNIDNNMEELLMVI